MNYLALLSSSVWALLRNEMRSLLTVLGITIGIAAVICVVAIGRAGQARVEQQLNNLGDNFVWIEAGGRAVNGAHTIHRTSAGLDPDEVVAQVVELLLHAGLTCPADRHHTDDRRDSDGDAQHREQAAHLVPEKGPNRAAEQCEIVHRFPGLRSGEVAICHVLPHASSTIARRSPYGVCVGSSSESAPAWMARRYVSSVFST